MIGNIIKHEKRDYDGWNDGGISSSYVDRMVQKTKDEMLQEIKDNLKISINQIGNKDYKVELLLDGDVISSTEFWV